MASEPPQPTDPDAFVARLENEAAHPAEAFVAGWPGLDAAQALFPERLVGALERAAKKTGSPSVINPSALSLALFGADGRMLSAEPRFQDWLAVTDLPPSIYATDGRSWPRAFLAEERVSS